MPDSKISGLTSATTPLAGTEVLPIVQSSTTRQVSIANVTAGRAVSALSFEPTGSSAPTNGVYLGAANSLTFATASTERMRIDSSGNLGLGVTPNASWGATSRSLTVNAGAFFSGRTDAFRAHLGLNAYESASDVWNYAAALAATRYTQIDGAHQWFNAPSGTAGTTITFTQAMTLDASGNLGLGVTPSAIWTTAKGLQIKTGFTAMADNANFYMSSNSYYNGTSWIYQTSNFATRYDQENGKHLWHIAPSGIAGNAITFTQAMTLDTSGNLGLGATSITAIYGRTLQIGSGSTESSLSLLGSTGNGFVATTGATFGVFGRGGMALVLGSNDVEKMRITSTGDVGIGTSSPGVKLDIRGSAVGSNFAAISVDNTAAGSGSPANTVSINFSNGGAAKASITGAVYGDGYLAFATNNNTEKMRITAAGDVGIATTSPTNKLHVVGSGDILRFTNGTVSLYGYSDSAGLGWFTGTGGTNVGVYYNNTSSYQSFYTSSTERMRIDSTGNVGIGTASPASKLHVVGDIQQDNANYIKGKLAAGTATRLFGLNAVNSLYIGGIDAAQSETLFTRGGTTQMTLDASGNLGIGATPTRKLSVVGSAVSTYINVNSGDNTSLAGLLLGGTTTPSAGQLLYDNTSNSMQFFTSGTERMRIDSTGNVGIGTSSPGARLVVQQANNSGDGIRVFASGSDTQLLTRYLSVSDVWQISASFASTGAYKPIALFTSDLERMRIDAAGNVGIGVTPSYKLDVAGDMRGTGTNGLRLTNVTGTDLRNNASGTILDSYSASAVLAFHTQSTERMRITSAGNIHTPAGATTMTDGFIYIPAAAGAPSGAATAITGTVPLYYNSAGNTLYAYNTSWQAISGGLSLVSTNANGVVYLNGSSQATTSTTLTYVAGTALTSDYYVANGAITGSRSQGAYAYGTLGYSDQNILTSLTSSTTSYNQIILQNTNAGSNASTNFIVSNNSGTASAFYGEFGMNSSGFTGTGSLNLASAVYLTATSSELVLGTTTANGVRFVVNSGATDAMRLDSGGNLGLGVTPSAWATGSSAFQTPAFFAFSNTTGGILSNLYYDNTANYKYVGTAVANGYFLGSVGHQWYTAPSGTAGTNATITERMRLTTAGNLGINNTSPAYLLDVTTSARVTGGLILTGLATPGAPSGAGSTTGGTLAAATYFAKVVAIDVNGQSVGVGAESTGVTTTGSTSSIVWTWTAVTGAVSYQLYFGTTSGTGYATYFTTATNSYTLTTTAGASTNAFGQPSGNTTGSITANGTILGSAVQATGSVAGGLGFLAWNTSTSASATAGISFGTNVSLVAASINQYSSNASIPNELRITNATLTAGTGGAGPMTFYTNGVERFRIDTSGAVYAQTSTSTGLNLFSALTGVGYATTIQQFGSAATGTTDGVSNAGLGIIGLNNSADGLIQKSGAFNLRFSTNGAERMRLTSAGVLQMQPVGSEGGEINWINATGGVVGGTVDISTNDNFRVWTSTSNAVLQIGQLASTGGTVQLYTAATERMRITENGNITTNQPAQSAQNTSATLTIAQIRTRIITANAAVTLTLPTGTTLDTYAANMPNDAAFEVTFIATAAAAITIAANANTTVGSLTVAANTSGTYRFRKTAANTFTVYRL